MKPVVVDQEKIVFSGFRKDADGNASEQRAIATIWYPSESQIQRASVSVRVDIEGWEQPLVDRELYGDDSLEAFQLAMILASTSITNKLR